MKYETHTTRMNLVVISFASGAPRCSALSEESVVMRSKVELIYCVMVVATAVLAGIVKCTVAAACRSCSDFVDP